MQILIKLLDAKQVPFHICRYIGIFVAIQGGLAVQRNVRTRKQKAALTVGEKQELYSGSAGKFITIRESRGGFASKELWLPMQRWRERLSCKKKRDWGGREDQAVPVSSPSAIGANWMKFTKPAANRLLQSASSLQKPYLHLQPNAKSC